MCFATNNLKLHMTACPETKRPSQLSVREFKNLSSDRGDARGTDPVEGVASAIGEQLKSLVEKLVNNVRSTATVLSVDSAARSFSHGIFPLCNSLAKSRPRSANSPIGPILGMSEFELLVWSSWNLFLG